MSMNTCLDIFIFLVKLFVQNFLIVFACAVIQSNIVTACNVHCEQRQHPANIRVLASTQQASLKPQNWTGFPILDFAYWKISEKEKNEDATKSVLLKLYPLRKECEV